MGGCYNAQLGAGMPKLQKQEPPAPPAAAPAAEGAAGYRRRVKHRRAAFGANKAVSCTGGIGDILKSLSTKDAPCTLATLHRLFHTMMIVVGLVGVLRAIIPQGKLKGLVMPLFTLIVASVTLSNYSPKQFRRDGDHFVSRIVELVLLIFYFVPALSKVVVLGPQVPLVTPLAKGVVDIVDEFAIQRLRNLVALVPGLQQVSTVGL